MSGVEGAGIARLGRARLVAKVCALILGLSLAVFGFCAAYVMASGATLFVFNAVVVAFFVSLAASFLSMIGCLISSVKLSAVDEYDLSLSLPSGTFVCGNKLRVSDVPAAVGQGSSVGTEITFNAKGRKLRTFDSTSVVMALVLAVAFCTFTTSLGIIAAQNSAAGIVGIVSTLQAPTIVGQACLAALAVTLSVLVIHFLWHGLFGKNSQLMVLEDGYSRRFPDKEIISIAEQANFQLTDIMRVRVYRATEPTHGAENVHVSV